MANFFLYYQARDLADEKNNLLKIIEDYKILLEQKEHDICAIFNKYNRFLRYTF